MSDRSLIPIKLITAQRARKSAERNLSSAALDGKAVRVSFQTALIRTARRFINRELYFPPRQSINHRRQMIFSINSLKKWCKKQYFFFLFKILYSDFALIIYLNVRDKQTPASDNVPCLPTLLHYTVLRYCSLYRSIEPYFFSNTFIRYSYLTSSSAKLKSSLNFVLKDELDVNSLQ